MRSLLGCTVENINVFTPDDLKNLDPDKFNAPRNKKPASAYREELVDFYTKYGLDTEERLAGVDKAMDKWKGREERMLAAVRKKYKAEIDAYDASKSEL